MKVWIFEIDGRVMSVHSTKERAVETREAWLESRVDLGYDREAQYLLTWLYELEVD